VVWQCHADAGVTLCVDAHRVPGVPASPWRARLHDLSIAADIQVHAADVLRLLRQGGGASSYVSLVVLRVVVCVSLPRACADPTTQSCRFRWLLVAARMCNSR